MKKLLLFLFFCVAQFCLFYWLKKSASFTQAKMIFATGEAIICAILGSLYLSIRLQKKERGSSSSNSRTQTPISQITASDFSEMKTKLETEKKELLTTFEAIQQNLIEQKSACRLETEKKEQLQLRLDEIDQKTIEISQHKKFYTAALRELSTELQKLCQQLEQDRKTHAIEIRALLGKEEKKIPGGTQSTPSPGLIVPTLSPLSAALLIILHCQKGFENQENSSWPSPEHRDLIRRAFFDRVQQTSQISLAAFSIEKPMDLYVSPKFPQPFSSKEVKQLSEKYGELLRQLSPFEPFKVEADQLQKSYTAFRIAYTNLDDLIILVPL